MRVLVLGGYGLIGSHVVRHLLDAGCTVVGLGRNVTSARRRTPEAAWVVADIAKLTTTDAWSPILEEARADAIVNCAGALQDGARDDISAVHSLAMRALYAAATRHGVAKLVQISAVGVREDSATPFMRSKAEADTALQAAGLEWTILRPGLVIAREAYGGTALLRALAAMPLVCLVVHGDRPVQTVGADDVARAVVSVLQGAVPSRHVFDLVEDGPRPLRDLVRAMRAWLGYPPVPVVDVPPSLARVLAYVADGLGWLGWRSPLRSTALSVLGEGVTGDPAPWRQVTGAPLDGLEATLRRQPATVQERWFARALLVKPLAIATLAGFWIVTGLVTLAAPERAAQVLTSRGTGAGVAQAAAYLGACLDLALGLAILWRPALMHAARGMIALTLAYLAGGTLLAPDLWADPLGPLVKAVPALVLAIFVLAVAEDR